jgi:hypothetical protein
MRHHVSHLRTAALRPFWVPESNSVPTIPCRRRISCRWQLIYLFMTKEKNVVRPKIDLEAEAIAALEAARTLPPGPQRTEALKKAGILQKAVDGMGLLFASSADLQGKPDSQAVGKKSRLIITRRLEVVLGGRAKPVYRRYLVCGHTR